MTYTPPTDDDLAAIQNTADYLHETIGHLTEDAARLTLVRDRLAVPAPPPPPAKPALSPVGVVGASSWNQLPAIQRQDALHLMRQAGITHFRLGVPWSSVERRPGVYALDFYKTLVREVVYAELVPIIVTGYTPTDLRPAGGDMFSAPRSPAYEARWEGYLRALFVALCPLGAWRYEIWNEPNHKGPPGMWPVSPGLYSDMCMIAHKASCDFDRRIRLVAGAISPAPDKLPNALGGTKFLEQVLQHEPDFFSFVDEWSLHPYAGTTTFLDGPMWKKHYGPTRALMPANIPMSATECGWATAPGKGVTEQVQASRLTQAITDWSAHEAGVFYIFNWRDWGTGADRDNSQGLARLDGTLRPSYFAVKNLLVG